MPCFLALSYMCCHIGCQQVTDSLIDTNWNSIAGSCSFMVSVVSAVTMVASFDPYRFSQFNCFSLLRCSFRLFFLLHAFLFKSLFLKWCFPTNHFVHWLMIIASSCCLITLGATKMARFFLPLPWFIKFGFYRLLLFDGSSLSSWVFILQVSCFYDIFHTLYLKTVVDWFSRSFLHFLSLRLPPSDWLFFQ